jgi:NAD-dependent SIR2 family protein deacetylase
MQPLTPDQTQRIKELWHQAEGIVILAGAGMSVDSGLPDFRGATGLWTEAKENFLKKATAKSFDTNPLDAWNFYVGRMIKYQDTVPHEGYKILLDLLQSHNKKSFVVTSNVDGHFLKAGYDPQYLYEIHGNLRKIQCTQPCCRNLPSMPKFSSLLTSEQEIPKCPYCNKNARPNVLMFNDPGIVWTQIDQGQENFRNWAVSKMEVLGIEIGAGTGIPSIRIFGQERTTNLIRINPHEFVTSRTSDLGISAGGLEGIRALERAVG